MDEFHLADEQAGALFRRWLALSETQRRTLEAIGHEVTATSSDMETHVNDLSSRFQKLSGLAAQQTGRIEAVLAMIGSLETEGETIPMRVVTDWMGGMLDQFVEKVISLSKQAMMLVYALEDVNERVVHVDDSVAQIDKITRQSNFLALNAMIEAKRAGESGAAFNVVANEVKQLSLTTRTLSEKIKQEIGAMTGALHNCNAILQQISTIDMSDNIIVKERLGKLVDGLTRRDTQVGHIVSEVTENTSDMAREISSIITDMQFQDRSKQRLELVTDTLVVLAEACHELQGETESAAPSLAEHSAVDIAWISKVIDRFKLGAVRQRFVEHLLLGDDPSCPTPDPQSAATTHTDSGDLELF